VGLVALFRFPSRPLDNVQVSLKIVAILARWERAGTDDPDRPYLRFMAETGSSHSEACKLSTKGSLYSQKNDLFDSFRLSVFLAGMTAYLGQNLFGVLS
jgi:hypothetical protein